MLQNLLGGEQGPLPGWWARNLSPANTSVVPTQAETVSMHVLRRTEGEERKPAPQPSYSAVYSLSQACALCRPTVGPLRGSGDFMLWIEPRADLASLPQEFPAAALNPLQLPVIPGPFRRAQAPRNGSASRTPPALTKQAYLWTEYLRSLYQCLMSKCAAENAACH